MTIGAMARIGIVWRGDDPGHQAAVERARMHDRGTAASPMPSSVPMTKPSSVEESVTQP